MMEVLSTLGKKVIEWGGVLSAELLIVYGFLEISENGWVCFFIGAVMFFLAVAFIISSQR